MFRYRNGRIARAAAMAALSTIGLLLPSAASSQDPGYRQLWSGYTSIRTCVKGKDVYQLGPYIFACSGYDYSYHYGNVVLLGTALTYGGRSIVIGQLCLEGTDTCLDGEIYLASNFQSANELTDACQDARQQVDQSKRQLEYSTDALQSCLRNSGYDDDCGSKFRSLKSDFSTHESNVQRAQSECQ